MIPLSRERRHGERRAQARGGRRVTDWVRPSVTAQSCPSCGSVASEVGEAEGGWWFVCQTCDRLWNERERLESDQPSASHPLEGMLSCELQDGERQLPRCAVAQCGRRKRRPRERNVERRHLDCTTTVEVKCTHPPAKVGCSMSAHHAGQARGLPVPSCPTCQSSEKVRPLRVSDVDPTVQYRSCEPCGLVWATRDDVPPAAVTADTRPRTLA